MAVFGFRLRKARRKMQMSQVDMAQSLELSRQAISNYECGKREPDLSTVAKMSALLGVSTDYLLGFTYETPPSPTYTIADNDTKAEYKASPSET